MTKDFIDNLIEVVEVKKTVKKSSKESFPAKKANSFEIAGVEVKQKRIVSEETVSFPMTKKLFPAYVESFSFSHVSVKIPSDDVFCHSPINQLTFSINGNRDISWVCVLFEELHVIHENEIANTMKKLRIIFMTTELIYEITPTSFSCERTRLIKLNIHFLKYPM